MNSKAMDLFLKTHVLADISKLISHMQEVHKYSLIDDMIDFDRDISDKLKRLTAPVRTHYGETAIAAGWTQAKTLNPLMHAEGETELWTRPDAKLGVCKAISAYHACLIDGLQPKPAAIIAYYQVSRELAMQLERFGESICHDFGGLTVWGRSVDGDLTHDSHLIKIADFFQSLTAAA